MNPLQGWVLAGLALAVGGWAYGWPGLVLGFSVVVFWLLLQFSRSVRVMKRAAAAPVGKVPSAVMLNAKLRRGMSLLQIIALTGSLGRDLMKSPETWAWSDDGGAAVELVLVDARLDRWRLLRPAAAGAEPAE